MLVKVQSAVPFLLVQSIFWFFLIRSWVLVFHSKTGNFREFRRCLALGSLSCASIALILTFAMTIYSSIGQEHPYDRWEGKYLFYTTILSLAGIVLGLTGKARPRIIGLLTSAFTFLIAFADAVAL